MFFLYTGFYARVCHILFVCVARRWHDAGIQAPGSHEVQAAAAAAAAMSAQRDEELVRLVLAAELQGMADRIEAEHRYNDGHC